ncbi:hypothetical protein [Rubripirellula reticaptiva]|uniref:Uncharacterized protein n=1 Tax=Rubripirellula reticaptiva TaxID=2528013 RepID=A0A5C6EIQ3_9BACT|nr:hypothetical protein [Rubripirellula reticaptiva]TWU48360.1 hypothetical protein Poly59_52060 [Rubripirellula reticaptiva]
MSSKHPKQLIDETELRTALQPLRPNPNGFAAGIRQRLEEGNVRLRDSEQNEASFDHSGWAQVAAAVMPLPLLGSNGGAGLVKLGQLSLGKKVVAVAALPMVGLLLMVTASIWAIIRIRRAQRSNQQHQGQSIGDIDAVKLSQVTADWWRQFGVLVVGMSVMSVLLMVIGYTLPVFIVFMVSGITMVSLITKLGQEHLVDRNTIAGTLLPGLLMLVQVTHVITMIDHGNPFLDQMLIPAVLVLGGFAMLWMCAPPWEGIGRATDLVARSLLGIGLLLIASWFSSSLWNPVTTQDLKTHVESFDHARFSSATWNQWQVAAEWLQDSNVQLDLSKPHAMLKTELAKDKPNLSVLRSAIEAGLFQRQDLDRLFDAVGSKSLMLAESKTQMFREQQRGQPFISADDRTRFLIHALVLGGELSESERDFLGERLTATMDSLATKTYVNLLEQQLAITKLAILIDRPLDTDSLQEFVRHTLTSHQRLGVNLGTRRGGFASSPKLNHSIELATVDAIGLMQIYGVPEDIRIDALRSYLRPTSHDHWFQLYDQTCMRVASLQRLESLPDVQPISWQDYLRYEQNLMMAILFTLVCVFATLGATKSEFV